ncbi:MAG: acylneuraminate cytidylyltransferase family protein [Syntrophaceae bacterium]
MKIIALIPARSGSKRCPGKNTRMFFGHPLIAYTIRSAKAAGIFTDIVVSTDSQETMEIATSYGAHAILRPDEISQDHSTDYQWVEHALKTLGCHDDAFGILRPTNPFRTVETIKACWEEFRADRFARGLRTMREAREHPDKMWWPCGGYALPFGARDGRWERVDMPTQLLANAYYQDGLFYINLTDNVYGQYSLTLPAVIPHITTFPENLDINTEMDWLSAEALVENGMVKLPE